MRWGCKQKVCVSMMHLYKRIGLRQVEIIYHIYWVIDASNHLQDIICLITQYVSFEPKITRFMHLIAFLFKISLVFTEFHLRFPNHLLFFLYGPLDIH